MMQRVNCGVNSKKFCRMKRAAIGSPPVSCLILASPQYRPCSVSVAVTKTDYGTLDRLLTAKADVLTQLDRHNSDLQNWLLAHGFKENAVSYAISTYPQNDELSVLWQDFKQIIGNCQLKNGANGSIVRGCLEHTQQILNLLTGQAIDSKPSYTAQGKCDEETASRRLAKA